MVVATGRNEALLASLQNEATHQGLSLSAAPLDVTDDGAAAQTIRLAVEAHGRLDALVNNAGYGLWGPLESLTLDEVRAQFETNLFGVLRLSQLALPHMRERGFGTIVNVGSVSGLIASPAGGAYAATKFALAGLSRAMRMEVAPFGVRVVLIEPGVFDTGFSANQAVGEGVLAEDSPYASRTSAVRTSPKSSGGHGLRANPMNVATRIRQVIESKRPNARYAVGIDARAGVMAARLLPDGVLDFAVRRVLRW